MTRTPTTLGGCVELALGVLPEDVGRRFAENPIAALMRGLSLKVRSAEHLTDRRAEGGSCDGLKRGRQRPTKSRAIQLIDRLLVVGQPSLFPIPTANSAT